jgi:hypothetical protein
MRTNNTVYFQIVHKPACTNAYEQSTKTLKYQFKCLILHSEMCGREEKWKYGKINDNLSPRGDEVVATTATERSLFASDFQLGFLTFYVVMFSYKVIKLCFQNCDEGKTTALTICN